MSIKDEIQKPIVKLVYVDSGTEDPTHCIFEVEVNFKPVDGVVPYPPLKYPSKRKSILTSESEGPELLATLLSRVQKHKDHHDFIKSKQAIVDSFLDQMWGE